MVFCNTSSISTIRVCQVMRQRTRTLRESFTPTFSRTGSRRIEIQRQEQVQRDLLEAERLRTQQKMQLPQDQGQQKPDVSLPKTPPVVDTSQKKPQTGKKTPRTPLQQKNVSEGPETRDTSVPHKPDEQASSPPSEGPSVPSPDDDEPDEL